MVATPAFGIEASELGRNLYKLEGAMAASPAVMRRMLTQMMIRIDREVKTFARSGGAFSPRSRGILASKSGWKVSGEDIGVLTTGVAHGVIQEFGGVTKPHEIRAKASPFRTEFSWRRGQIIGKRERGQTGGVLAFQMGGRTVFAKSVQHPGSRIPGTHYARKSFERVREEVKELGARIIRESMGEKN
jgi:hypothetical protein